MRIHPSELNYKSLCAEFQSQEIAPEILEIGSRVHAAVETLNKDGLSDDEVKLYNKITAFLESEGVNREKTENEVKINYDFTLIENSTISGRIDMIYWETRENPIIYDWKFGFLQAPEIQNNLQLKCYAYGLMLLDKEIQTVRCVIYNPRINQLDRHTYSRRDMLRLATDIFLVVNRVQKSKYYRTGSHCANCQRLLSCPAVSMQLKEVQNLNIIPYEIDSSPDNIARLLDLKKIMSAYFDRVTEIAEGLLKDNVEVPGYSLAYRYPAQKIPFSKARELGIDCDSILVTVAELKRLANSEQKKYLELLQEDFRNSTQPTTYVTKK